LIRFEPSRRGFDVGFSEVIHDDFPLDRIDGPEFQHSAASVDPLFRPEIEPRRRRRENLDNEVRSAVYAIVLEKMKVLGRDKKNVRLVDVRLRQVDVQRGSEDFRGLTRGDGRDRE